MGRTAGAVSAFVVLAAAAAAEAKDIHLPGDFRNLQEALYAANPGDRILLDRGTYRGRFLLRTDGVEIVGSPRARIVGIPGPRDEARIPALRMVGDDCSVRGVSFRKGGVQIEGNRGLVEECTVSRVRDRESWGILIEVIGIGGAVRGNVIERTAEGSTGIRVAGFSATASGNSVAGRGLACGLVASGSGPVVEGNEVAVDPSNGGILVEGQDALIVGNRVSTGDLCIIGDGAHVEDNEVVGTSLGRASFLVQGDRGFVSGNSAAGGLDTGFLILGDGNLVEDNACSGNGSEVDGMTFGHGFVVRGGGNILLADTADGCLGEGFRIAGSSQWWGVPRATDGNDLFGCTGTGAGTCGLGNWTTGTSVTDSTFTGNGVDIVDGTGFSEFEGNTWETGGPGYVGSGTGAASDDVYHQVNCCSGGFGD